MINFTLTKSQQAYRDYIHQVAVEAMRPISLQCDRDEQIPEAFFWDMQKRLSPSSVPQALEQGGEKQTQIRSMLLNEELAWGDAALSTALPGPGLAAPPLLSQGTPEQQAKFFALYAVYQLNWGACAMPAPGMVG